ncbi:hypothetical protein Tco_0854861 [Tanacetum coccineum]
MLKAIGEIMLQDRQGLLNVTIEKILLAQAQESGQALDEEQLACLADPRFANGQDTQPTIIHNATYQTNDLDAYDSDYDDIWLISQVTVQTSSPRMNNSIEASRSKPRSNTKKDRIPQTSSSNKKKNKVEDHPRIAKSSLNNKNHEQPVMRMLNIQR